MLYGLEPRFQKCFERHEAYEMSQELKLVFQTHAREVGDLRQVLRLKDGGELLS